MTVLANYWNKGIVCINDSKFYIELSPDLLRVFFARFMCSATHLRQ